jgi:hypothetical protein
MLGPLGNTSMSESSTLVRALLMILLVSGTLIVIMSNFFRAGLTCRPEARHKGLKSSGRQWVNRVVPPGDRGQMVAT